MIRKPVPSSHLKAIGYEPHTQTLEVEFHGGKVYQHAGVSPQHHAALISAPSVGRHYHGLKQTHPGKPV